MAQDSQRAEKNASASRSSEPFSWTVANCLECRDELPEPRIIMQMGPGGRLPLKHPYCIKILTCTTPIALPDDANPLISNTESGTVKQDNTNPALPDQQLARKGLHNFTSNLKPKLRTNLSYRLILVSILLAIEIPVLNNAYICWLSWLNI